MGNFNSNNSNQTQCVHANPMLHTVCVDFTFKTLEDKTKFMDILKSENGLVKTRAWPGCVLIECYGNDANDRQLVLWEKWDKQSDHESYMEMRKEAGMLDLLGSMLEQPLDIVRLSCIEC